MIVKPAHAGRSTAKSTRFRFADRGKIDFFEQTLAPTAQYTRSAANQSGNVGDLTSPRSTSENYNFPV